MIGQCRWLEPCYLFSVKQQALEIGIGGSSDPECQTVGACVGCSFWCDSNCGSASQAVVGDYDVVVVRVGCGVCYHWVFCCAHREFYNVVVLCRTESCDGLAVDFVGYREFSLDRLWCMLSLGLLLCP